MVHRIVDDSNDFYLKMMTVAVVVEWLVVAAVAAWEVRAIKHFSLKNLLKMKLFENQLSFQL